MKEQRTINYASLKIHAWTYGVKKTAKKADLSVSTVDKIINGRWDFFPSEETQINLSKALKLSREDLFPIKKTKKKV